MEGKPTKSILKSKKSRGSIAVALAFVFLLVAGIYFAFLYLRAECSATVKFGVSTVDNRFQVNTTEVKNIAEEAAYRWNSQAGQNLLQYDPDALLKVELVYDQRQTDLDNLNSMSNALEKDKGLVGEQSQNFETMLANYQADLNAYNAEVLSWNAKGGAPQDVYQNLQQKKKDLDKNRDSLIKLSESLNLNIENYNSELSNLKDEAAKRENVIITQGLYIPSQNKIQIYTFGNKDELRLVLMHELGHSLGLNHEQNQNSIMHYLLGNQDLKNPKLSSEDVAMLDGRCNINNKNFYTGFFKFIPKTVQ